MKKNSNREGGEELNELLKQYENLRFGRKYNFLDEDCFEKIIEYYNEQGNFPKAIEACELAIEQYPYSSALLIKKGDLLLACQQYEKALEVLEKAELLGRNDINLYILKTDAYLALDQQEQAVSILEEALLSFSGEERIELLFELADVYDDYEEFDKVFDCLKLVLEDEPNNEEALYKICFWTDFTGRSEESIRLHNKIINEYPYNELAWFNLAAAYQGLKLYEKAIDAYQYAITIDEKFDYAYRNIGDAYIRMRKYKDAIEALEKVLELSKPEDVIYEAIGHCYDRLKKFGQARFNYRKASHLNQKDAMLFYKIACTYYNERQWESACKQLTTSLKINHKHAESCLLMGECKIKLEQLKDAIQCFSDVIRLKPKNMSGWEALIRCLYKGAFYEEAMEQAQAALQVTEGRPLFYFYQSAVLFAMGKSKEAILHLDKAISKSPKGIKKFIELNPAILQNQHVVDLLAKYKRNKTI